jgi:hypothetical protein
MGKGERERNGKRGTEAGEAVAAVVDGGRAAADKRPFGNLRTVYSENAQKKTHGI